MIKNILLNHFSLDNDFINYFKLTFMLREPIDLPPIVSVELIQISDKTNIPYALRQGKLLRKRRKKKMKELFLNRRHHLLKLRKNQIGYLFQM